jgi:photosystem II stability/assembly factor-like uncharacterized protein
MKLSKIFLLGILVLVVLSPVEAQLYKEMIEEGIHTVWQIQEEAERYFSDRDKGRGSGYKQFKRWEYNALRLMNEEGYLTAQSDLIKEWERVTAERNAKGLRSTTTDDYWEDMGPTYWNATSGWNPGVGRLTSFSVDPDNTQHIIVGAQTGGVWKTHDGGQQWTPLCDFFSNMEVYATAMHPFDKNVYYFGSNGGRIYKSVDGGATWQPLASAGNSLVNKLLIHPENPDLMFASVQSSGMYRTENGGNSWTRMTNDPSSFDIVFKPGDLSTIYASGSSFHKSTDGGQSFTSFSIRFPLTLTGATSVAGNHLVTDNSFSPGRIPIPMEPNGIETRLVLYKDDEGALACVPPLNPQEIAGNIAVVRRGACNFTDKVIHAQNAGALAVLLVNNQPGNIVMGGGDANISIPAVSIVSDLGESIIDALEAGDIITARLEMPLSNSFTAGPKMIGVSKDNPELVYVLEAAGSIFGALYKSEDAGANFTVLDQQGRNYFGYSTAGLDNSGQAPRDMAIAVNPSNAQEVHIAGILTWRSLDGGISFECTSDWIPGSAAAAGIGYCHADVDIMEFVGEVLYVGTDGGLFYAEDTENLSPDYFIDITEGLGIRQFYKIGISQTDPVVVSGGSQDNGTSVYTQEAGWVDWLGADGMETFVDKEDPEVLYGTSQFGNMYKSINGGNSFFSISNPGSERGNWVTPFEQDPNASQTIYVGYEEIFKSETGGGDWQLISPTFPVKINHLKIAPSDSRVMYCAFQGQLHKTLNGGDSWFRIGVNSLSGNVNFIAIHPRDPNRIAIAITGGQKVLVSLDGGETFSSYLKNLPNFSALCLLWQDNEDLGLYLGMNYGIYYIDDTYEDWQLYNSNLPNVIINELEINYANDKIYAATYGRGLWVSDVYQGLPTATQAKVLENQLRLYPVPTQSTLVLEWAQAQGIPSYVELYDASGRLVKYSKDQEVSRMTMDMGSLPTGNYYVRVGNTLGTITKKIIKN